MSDNIFLLNDEKSGVQQSEFLLATIVTADGAAGTARILIDGMMAANVKPYKAMVSAWPLAQGDRVVVMKLSGTYLILGKIGNQPSTEYEPAFEILPISKGGTGQKDKAYKWRTEDVLTIGTGLSAISVYLYYWGKLAVFSAAIKGTTAGTDSTFTMGQLLPAWRPAVHMSGCIASGEMFEISSDGTIKVYAQRSATRYYNLGIAYMLK